MSILASARRRSRMEGAVSTANVAGDLWGRTTWRDNRDNTSVTAAYAPSTATVSSDGSYWWSRSPIYSGWQTYANDNMYSPAYYQFDAPLTYTAPFRVTTNTYSWDQDRTQEYREGELIIKADDGKVFCAVKKPNGTTELVEICRAPYNDLVVEHATVVENPPGRSPGKYLEITLSSGETIVTSLESLVDVYTQSFDPYTIMEAYKRPPKDEEGAELKNTKPIGELFG